MHDIDLKKVFIWAISKPDGFPSFEKLTEQTNVLDEKQLWCLGSDDLLIPEPGSRPKSSEQILAVRLNYRLFMTPLLIRQLGESGRLFEYRGRARVHWGRTDTGEGVIQECLARGIVTNPRINKQPYMFYVQTFPEDTPPEVFNVYGN